MRGPVHGVDRRDDLLHDDAERRADRVRRAGRRPRAGGRQPGQDRQPGRGRHRRHDRRPVRRVEGVASSATGSLDVDERGPRRRDLRPDREVRPQPSSCARWPTPRRRCDAPTSRSRTCCASWRRRSSARWCAGTASSTPARTPSRRRCWRPRCSGRPTGCRTTRGPGCSPSRPAGWSTSWRSESARRRREEPAAALEPVAAGGRRHDRDDTLTLLFLCCHPSLSAPSQLALTLRAVGGLTTAEIARAFLVPEATMAQRISRAKQSIKAAGAAVRPAAGGRARPSGCASCCTCSTWSSTRATRPRSGAAAAAGRPDGRGDPAGPAAAPAAARRRRGRRAARADAADRRPPAGPHRPRTARWCRWPSRTASSWDAALIAEGIALITATLGTAPGRALPAAGRDRRGARRGADAPTTDWPQILALYEVLERVSPEPGGHAQPGGRRGHGPRAAGRPGRCSARSTATSGWPTPTASTPCAAHLLELAGDRRRPGGVPARGPADREPPGAALPPAPRRRTP